MARKYKIKNSLLERLNRSGDGSRVEGVRKPRKYFLLFCEGARTEPAYFTAFAKLLPNHLVSLEVDQTGGLNTISLVNHAIKMLPEYQKQNPNIDLEVWIVFDRDSFPNQHVNQAVATANRVGFKCAFSNEAFELWYLLHFENYTAALSRQQYGGLLSNHLGKRYEKNDPNLYNLLQTLDNSEESLAIRYAKGLKTAQAGKTPSNSCPFTSVYKLVEELNKFKPAAS